MFLNKLEEISRFLVVSEASSDEVCRFLNFQVFNYLESRAIYFAELTNDGCLQPVGDYGFAKGAVENWGSFPLTVDIPMTAAVRQDSLIHIKSPDDLYKKFPVMKQVEKIDHNWASILAIPVHAFGVYTITSFKQPEIDEVHERFLRTVGQLACTALNKHRLLNRIRSRGSRTVTSTASGQLTQRQGQIKKLLQRGLTNVEIAREIGYSDSLVRQETMAIYSALNVSGRKELIENPEEVK